MGPPPNLNDTRITPSLETRDNGLLADQVGPCLLRYLYCQLVDEVDLLWLHHAMGTEKFVIVDGPRLGERVETDDP